MARGMHGGGAGGMHGRGACVAGGHVWPQNLRYGSLTRAKRRLLECILVFIANGTYPQNLIWLLTPQKRPRY